MNTPSAPDNAVSSEPRSPDAVDRPNSRKHLLLSRPPPVIRVAILDDHPVVALGLGAYLDARPGFRVIHQETSARRLLDKLAITPCDIALVDFYLPQEPWDGVNYLRRLRRYHPNLAIITFSAGNRQEPSTPPSAPAPTAIWPSNGACCCCPK